MDTAINYSIVYSIVDMNVACGIMATYDNLYTAQKYYAIADKAFRDSGLAGTVELVPHETGPIIEDPRKFFEEDLWQ